MFRYAKVITKVLWCTAVLLPAGSVPGPLERGAEALRRQNFPSAIRDLTQAVAAEPANARAHKLLGMAYSAVEKYAEAAESFQASCKADPREENACYYLGRALYSLNRFED